MRPVQDEFGVPESRVAVWLTVALYAGAAAVLSAALLVGGTFVAPDTFDRDQRARLLEGGLHAVLGAAAGAVAVGRVRRDGAASGGSRAIAAAWLGLLLGLGAYTGGTLVDITPWSRRAEAGLPAFFIVVAGAAGAWLTVLTAGFGRLAPPLAPDTSPASLTDDERRLARAALEELDRSHVELARLANRHAEPALTRAEAHSTFVPSGEFATLCTRLAGTTVVGPLLDAGKAVIDALRLTIVARGWPGVIDIVEVDAWVQAVAAGYGLDAADADAVAQAVRQEAGNLRGLAAAQVKAVT